MSFIPNIFIAVTLAIFVYNNKNWLAIFIALFLYSSLHYSFFLDHSDVPLLPKLIGGIFVMSAYIYLFTLSDTKTILHVLQSNIILRRSLLLLCFFVIANIIYWVIDLIDNQPPPLLVIKTFIFSSITWLFACLSACIVLTCKITITDKFRKQIVNWTSILLTAATVVAVIEIWYGLSYARSLDHNIALVYRANSFLYNPNVFGLWISLYIIIIAFLYNIKFYTKNKLMALMFMAALSLVLTGSRGAFLTCLIMLSILFIMHLLQKGKFSSDNLLPIYFWGGSMILITVIALSLNYIGMHDNFTNSLNRNIERVYNTPLEVSKYVVTKLTGHLGYEVVLPISDFTRMSLDGRVSIDADSIGSSGELAGKDNIYLAILESGGWIGLLTWLAMWTYTIQLGLISLIKKPSIFSSYSLALVIGCAFAGLTMRTTQMFPVWVFISIPLSLSLAWFASVQQEIGHSQNKNMPVSSGLKT